MIKKISNAFDRVLEPIAAKLGKVLKPAAEKLGDTEPGVLRRRLNVFLLAEIIFFVGVAIYRHSIGAIFSDAFGATAVGGLYSFVMPFIENLNDPLMGLDKLELTDKAFFMWILSGFAYIALLKYNELIDDADYGKTMQIIHSILFSMLIGVVGSPIAILVLAAVILPVQPLWATGSVVLRILSVVLGVVGIGLLVVMLIFALKALVSTLKDFVKFYIFSIILLAALLVLLMVLSMLADFMYESALLSPIISFIDSLLLSAGVNEDSGVNLVTNANFVKVAVGIAIFLMYNISAVFHDDGFVV